MMGLNRCVGTIGLSTDIVNDYLREVPEDECVVARDFLTDHEITQLNINHDDLIWFDI